MLKKRFVFALGFLLVAGLLGYVFSSSPEQRLRTLDAGRAIPDAENAAFVYFELFSEYLDVSTASDFVKPVTKNQFEAIKDDPRLFWPTTQRYRLKTPSQRPWTRDDFPKIADALKIMSGSITTLRKASQFQHCRLRYCQPSDTLNNPIAQNVLVMAIEALSQSLIASAYLDIGEQRREEAMDKARTLVCIIKHFRPFIRPLDMLHIEERLLDIQSTLLLLENHKSPRTDELIRTYDPFNRRARDVRKRDEQIFQWRQRYFWKHASEATVIPTLWGHIRHCLRYQNWRRLFRYSLYCDRYQQKEEKVRRRILKAKYHLRCLIFAARQYKVHTGHWPTNWRQVSPLLPSNDVREMAGVPSEAACFGDEHFIIYTPADDTTASETQDLLVQDGRKLAEEELAVVKRYLEHCTRSLLANPRQEDRYGDALKKHFRVLGQHGSAFLIAKLQHGNTAEKNQALSLLVTEMAPVYHHQTFGGDTMQNLLSSYRQEKDLAMKEHYLIRLRFFVWLPPDPHGKLGRFLVKEASQGKTAKLRSTAALNLFYTAPLAGLKTLFADWQWLEDDTQFGEEGRRQVLRALYDYVFEYPGRLRSRTAACGTCLIRERPTASRIYGMPRHFYDHPADESEVASCSTELKQWWQINRKTVETISIDDPNRGGLLSALFDSTKENQSASRH